MGTPSELTKAAFDSGWDCERLRAELAAEREARERAEAACAAMREIVQSAVTTLEQERRSENMDRILTMLVEHVLLNPTIGTDLLERLRKAEADNARLLAALARADNYTVDDNKTRTICLHCNAWAWGDEKVIHKDTCILTSIRAALAGEGNHE